MTPNNLTLITLIAAILLGGCDSSDERLAKMAQDSVEQQSSQNKEMTQLNREVAQGVKQLVESENASRKELVAMQRDLQQQQAEVGKQRDRLESERQQIATVRLRESLLVPVISTIGLLAVCSLPCVLAWCLLRGWRSDASEDSVIGELLIQEVVSNQPVLLPPPESATASAHRQSLRHSNQEDAGEDEDLSGSE